MKGLGFNMYDTKLENDKDFEGIGVCVDINIHSRVYPSTFVHGINKFFMYPNRVCITRLSFRDGAKMEGSEYNATRTT